MKKILFLIALFCITLVSAQNVKVVYEITAKVDEKKFEMVPKEAREGLIKAFSAPIFYDLVFQNGISLYKKQKKNQIEKETPDELQSEPSPGTTVTVMMDEMNSGAYQDFNTGEYLEVKGIFGKPFLIKDKIANLDWKLTNEVEKVGNFDCKKATTHYNGKDITAWYTDELPIPVGPDIYNGLPGLIVKMVIDNRIIYKAISVENLKEEVTIEKPTFEKEGISREKFSEIKEKKKQSFGNQFINL